MIKIHFIPLFLFLIIISLALPIQNLISFSVDGEIENNDSILNSTSNTNLTNTTLFQSMNEPPPLIKPKVDVTIEGTLSDDKIKSGEGDDTIEGNEGYDTLYGGRGNDKIYGGKGNDIINGEFGNDKLKGEEGNDRISGERDNDKIDGGEGNDKIYGGRGDDEIDGKEGNDTIDGGEGIDELIGGIGADTFICDQFDQVIDFNTVEGDEITGCTAEDNAKPKTEEKLSSSP